MAKNWTYDKETGTLTRSYTTKVDDKVVPTAEPLNMDMAILFEDWDAYDNVQQQVIINGLKQKLDDAIARSKDQKLTDKEKRDVQGTLASRIFEDREWNMPSQAGTRGPSVSLAKVVPAMAEAGMDTKAIAQALGKTEEVVKQYIGEVEED